MLSPVSPNPNSGSHCLQCRTVLKQRQQRKRLSLQWRSQELSGAGQGGAPAGSMLQKRLRCAQSAVTVALSMYFECCRLSCVMGLHIFATGVV